MWLKQSKKVGEMLLGEDVFISEFAKIARPNLVSVGNHVAIDECTIRTALVLGDYVHISPYVSVVGGEDGILICKGFNNIMAGARIICVSDRFDDSGLFGALIPKKYHGRLLDAPVILELFANVATNAVMLPGAHLAMGAMLTVNSYLMGETEPWTKYRGNPAKPYAKINPAKSLRYAKEMGYDY